MPGSAYQPRDAERGVLYRVVAARLDAFLDAAAHHSEGARLPMFVEQEFRDFLICGVLAHGFARLRGAPDLVPPSHLPLLTTLYPRCIKGVIQKGRDDHPWAVVRSVSGGASEKGVYVAYALDGIRDEPAPPIRIRRPLHGYHVILAYGTLPRTSQ